MSQKGHLPAAAPPFVCEEVPLPGTGSVPDNFDIEKFKKIILKNLWFDNFKELVARLVCWPLPSSSEVLRLILVWKTSAALALAWKVSAVALAVAPAALALAWKDFVASRSPKEDQRPHCVSHFLCSITSETGRKFIVDSRTCCWDLIENLCHFLWQILCLVTLAANDSNYYTGWCHQYLRRDYQYI